MDYDNARRFIGNVSGSTRLFDDSERRSFDNIYALVEDVMGVPVIAQVLSTSPPEIIEAVMRMLQRANGSVSISLVDEFDLSNPDDSINH